MDTRCSVLSLRAALPIFEIELVSVVARESRLRRAIEASTTEYDYIFIDCPPSLGLLTVNALVAAEEVLIDRKSKRLNSSHILILIYVVGVPNILVLYVTS